MFFDYDSFIVFSLLIISCRDFWFKDVFEWGFWIDWRIFWIIFEIWLFFRVDFFEVIVFVLWEINEEMIFVRYLIVLCFIKGFIFFVNLKEVVVNLMVNCDILDFWLIVGESIYYM